MILDALALLVAKASFIGLRLLTLYLCASVVDPSAFGRLALAMTTAEVCRFAADWGTDTWALRRFADPAYHRAKGTFSWVLRQRSLASLLGSMVAWLAIGQLVQGLSLLVHLALALTVSTSLWLNVSVNWLQARASLRRVSALLAVVGLVCAASVVSLRMLGRGPDMMLPALVGFELLMAGLLVGAAWRKAASQAVDQSLPSLLEWLKESTPIALATLITLAYGRVDQYFVSKWGPADVLGDYMLAQRLVEPVLFVAAALSSTLYARASAVFLAADGQTPHAREYVRRWLKLSVVFGLGAALLVGGGLQLSSGRLLSQYIGLMPFLWIALACTVFRCVNLVLTAFIQAQGAYGVMFRLSLVNCVLIFSGVFGLGFLIGPIGAAVAVLVGEAVNSGVQFFVLRKRLEDGA